MGKLQVLLTIGLGLLWVATGGCGQSAPQGGSGGKNLSGMIVLDPAELPVLGGYEPPLGPQIPGLDNNRVKVPYPKGWRVGPQMNKVVVWFKESLKYDYPQILVTAEDFEQVLNVTESTISKFVHIITHRLRAKNPQIQVRPVRVGNRYGALYARRGMVRREFLQTELECQIIETVVDGRKYSFELRTYPGHAEKYAPYLYSVFAGTKFLTAAAGEETSGEKPPAEQPPPKPEPPTEKPKTKPSPTQSPAQPAPAEKPSPKETAPPEAKQPPKPKPSEQQPPAKSQPPQKPKKKTPFDFDIIE